MRMDITDVNRINTCGYLNKYKRDYGSKVSSNPSYYTGMKELLRWHYNRGKAIDQESFMTFIGNLHARLKTERELKIALETAFRNFINTEFYKNMTNVFCNYESDIKVNKLDYVEYVIPYFINDPNRPTFIYIEDSLIPQNIFLERFDVLHNAVWSFYSLGRNAQFLRFWFDGKEIRREVIKTDDHYAMRAKERLIVIGKNLNNFVVPTIQTCLNCSMISICERYNRSTKRGRNGKSTTRPTN
jgi:hypothetical protein